MVADEESVECPSCNRKFDSKRGMRIHHAQGHGESITTVDVKCHWCGYSDKEEEWVLDGYQERWFCSSSCRSEWLSERFSGKGGYWYGQESPTKGMSWELDKEARQNIAKAKEGEKNPLYNAGEDHPQYGEKRSEETRRKIAASLRDGYPSSVGFGDDWSEARQEVLGRDNNECVICGNSPVDVHHVVSRKFVYHHPFLDFEDVNIASNLVALCRSHHQLVESRGNIWDEYPDEVSGLEWAWEGGDQLW